MTSAPDTAGSRTRRADDTTVAVVLTVAVLAWLLLALTHGGSGYSHATGPTEVVLSGHRHGLPVLRTPSRPAPGAHDHPEHAAAASLVTRGGGWLLMVVAMMLPPALPLLRVVRRLAGDGPGRRVVVAASAGIFVAVWAVAGSAYLLVDILLRGLAEPAWLRAHAAAIVGVATVAAGVWQFMPAKRACLSACRSPLGVAMTQWGRGTPVADAARIGGSYAGVCVGCCWALMALTLIVGLPALPLMVVMSLVMALERILPRVRPAVPVVGVAAIALGVAVGTGIVPPAWLA